MPELQTVPTPPVGKYRPLTEGYWPSEYWMLRNVISDMQRGNIPYILVRELAAHPSYIAVWRETPTA